MMRSICLCFVVGACVFSLVGFTSRAAERPPTTVSKELLEKRLAAVRNVFRIDLERLNAGEAAPDEFIFMWSERLLGAELALADRLADRTAVLKAHVERVRELARIVTARAKAGQGRESDVETAKYFLIDAEIRLLEATFE